VSCPGHGHGPGPGLTADQALARLEEGNRRFLKD
jgi:hypothetical protein